MRWRRAHQRSAAISRTISVRIRVTPYGLANRPSRSFGGLLRTDAVLNVNSDREASPDSRLPTLTPSSAKSPLPSESRFSSAAQSAPELDTTIRPSDLSYQRNAGMSVLSPSRIPAWLAEVWHERSHSHGIRRWLPSSSQRATVGTWPPSMARRRVCSDSPSISSMNTPGSSVSSGRARRRAPRRMTAL